LGFLLSFLGVNPLLTADKLLALCGKSKAVLLQPKAVPAEAAAES